MEEPKGVVQPERDLPAGVPVYTRDGEHLGTVKEVFEQAFKVDAPMRPDYWLSTEAVASATEERYTLAIDGNRLHDYRVRNPHDVPEEKSDDPGGITGRAGVHPQSTMAAGLLVPDDDDRGSDAGSLRP